MDQIEKKIIETIDQNREQIVAFGRDIWHHAELGYREFRTAGKFNELLKSLGMEVDEGLAITGAKGYLKPKGTAGPTVAVIGELDALPIANHKDTNPETGAAHCCGHHAQLTATIGAALALSVPEVKEALDGNVVFMSTPSEEFVDIDYKNGLRKEGKARYGGGKCELIRIGAFEDIDVALGHHSDTDPEHDAIIMNCSSNVFVNKTVKFKGRKAHAAGFPEKGIDALNAAELALHGIALQRESFRDEDTVRCHGYYLKGGDAVNIIADDVVLEYCVRAKTMEAVKDANAKVDRSFKAGALATGCGLEIETLPGYFSTQPCPDVSALQAALDAVGEDKPLRVKEVPASEHITGSTDFGDVSAIMPLIQFYTTGLTGQLHNNNVEVVDEEIAYILPAKLFALTAYHLLKGDAAGARHLMEIYQPKLDRESYVEYMESMLGTIEMEMDPLPLLED
ncbi:amidohydrolase [Bittarella massiliensis (ex Durand et al. 2017)]|uniref:amidohydrolase n=1 Tax=Bittarella massiliensis (ex Durand et al. 2017) TaxID=1720313 RepID=UPI001AA14D91|nr:amidohydrolase [Bittarella massiliensis (ex Durand et al. 2017)]MBO1678465.1 amidohydrolase [Bittarella massiliensis (ex Durand et al. 2017)]